MARLLVLRHGKTEAQSGSGSDFDRELVPRGRRDSAGMGELIRRELPAPDVVVASPAARARQTAECVLSALGAGCGAVYDDRIYSASGDLLHDVLKDHASGAAAALVIGHNPGLVLLVRMMLAAGDGEGAASAGRFPTCALADVSFGGGTLGEGMAPGRGRLLSVLRPRELGFAR